LVEHVKIIGWQRSKVSDSLPHFKKLLRGSALFKLTLTVVESPQPSKARRGLGAEGKSGFYTSGFLSFL